MDHFYQLSNGSGMISFQELLEKVGDGSGLFYQYRQEHNLNSNLQSSYVFQPLTDFEHLLVSQDS